jgi:hypothetical protein
MRAFAGVAFGLCCLAAFQPHTFVQDRYVSYEKAVPVFAALGERMPSEREWGRWIAAADASTRARVLQGDEASIVNLLLFGTSFTSQPRITTAQLDPMTIERTVRARIDDFARALANPGTNERLHHAQRLLPAGADARPRLLSMIDRTMKEGEMLARLTAEAAALGDPSLEFAERSRLYRDRGLASDTSVRVNFAVEEALRRIQADRLVAGPVRRVAVIGPGLDVVDKQQGYDFYPPQTIQPFAMFDSLVRLGMARADTLQITTFDVSARVNDHLLDMARRARAGTPYVLHVSLSGDVDWSPGLLSYFARFGETIGSQLPVTVPPGVGALKLRTIAVRPPVVTRISARDLNITAQQPSLGDTEHFDLIVGTNIFVYYDRPQQGLAMVNMAGMLRPGGILLSNNALVEVPSAPMRSIGYLKTLYSNRDEDGDLVIWYQKDAASREQ